MVSFRDMKRSRQEMFDALNTQIEKDNTKGGRQKDDRYWAVTQDAAGNGYRDWSGGRPSERIRGHRA